MNSETGKWLILVGAGIVLVGLLIFFFHDKLHWIGRLPGDIRIENKNIRIYIPVMTMLLFSVLLSIIIFIIRKLFQ